MKEAGGGKEVVDIKKRRQPALGLSKMRVLDLVILDHFWWTVTKLKKKEEK